MSRATEPQGGASLCVAAPAPLDLTPDEVKMLAVFRAMDDLAKSHITKLSIRLAQLNPHRAAPALRLISGGTQ